MLLLAGLLQAAAPSLEVTRIVRITDAPGVRDNAVAVPSPRGLMVFWDESPGIDRAGAALPPVRIWRAILPRNSARPSAPHPFLTTHQNQWWPALMVDSRGGWLASYIADPDRRTGDRDIELQELDAGLEPKGRARQVTQDPTTAELPLNDATPALARTSDGRVVLVWSRGAYDERAASYRDKDLVLTTIGAGGTVAPERHLTGPEEAGREMAPALAGLSRGRLLLVYVSDSGQGGRPSLYARTIDSTLRAGPSRRLTRGSSGVTRPSLASFRAALWIAWYDLDANDVRIARFASDLSPSAPVSLRTLIGKAKFGRYGVPLAGLSGASLFVDQGRLGVSFVATMMFDRGAGRAQQDVFLARLEVR